MNGLTINPWDKDNLKRLKAISEIDAGIDAVLRMDLSSISYEDLRIHFFNLFELFPMTTLPLKKEAYKDFKVYRVRPFEAKFDITNPDTFSCPPWDKDIGIGRANWRNRNVFYASDSPHPALKEIKDLNMGSDFYIAKWGIDYAKLKLDKIPMATLLFANTKEENSSESISKYYGKFIEDLIVEIGTEASEKFVHLVKKINQLFVERDKSKYPITAFIADQIVYFKENTQRELYFPILVYPSVESDHKNYNFAIHPFFVRQYMRLEKVLHIKLNENEGNYLKVSIERIGICNSVNKVEWYTLSPDFSRSMYSIEGLNCHSCGKAINIGDIDQVIFKRGNSEITHGEILANYFNARDYTDFFDMGDISILEGNGMAIGMDFNFSNIPLTDIIAIVKDEDHTRLSMDIQVKQPFQYNPVVNLS